MRKSIKELKVGLKFGLAIQPVGRLAIRDGIIYFEYDNTFRERNLEISPIKLPLQRGVIQLPSIPFEGLAGVFNDSLPDGWGRLLFDRMLRAEGILPNDVTALDRLVYVGLNGMGALVYEPDESPNHYDEIINLDVLASQTEQVLEGESGEVINELLALNGSSAGARPKAMIGLDLEHWIVKFPNTQDGNDSGAIEYVYSIMAANAGLEMPATHLFSSQKGSGYYAVKRFDRNKNKRFHMQTVSGLIHSNFRFPSHDYEDLLALTSVLTKDIREVEKMFRLAVFNVMAHNRDDHAKNFSFLMDESGEWKLSPAYDLTFSNGPGGEQSTMVMGEGRNITRRHLEKLGLEAKLSQLLINEVIRKTSNSLNNWKILAKVYGVEKENVDLIESRIRIY